MNLKTLLIFVIITIVPSLSYIIQLVLCFFLGTDTCALMAILGALAATFGSLAALLAGLKMKHKDRKKRQTNKKKNSKLSPNDKKKIAKKESKEKKLKKNKKIEEERTKERKKIRHNNRNKHNYCDDDTPAKKGSKKSRSQRSINLRKSKYSNNSYKRINSKSENKGKKKEDKSEKKKNEKERKENCIDRYNDDEGDIMDTVNEFYELSKSASAQNDQSFFHRPKRSLEMDDIRFLEPDHVEYFLNYNSIEPLFGNPLLEFK